jgi:hypothetical protein
MKHPQTHPVLHILSLLVLLSLAALPPAPLPALQAQQAPPAAGPATGSGLTPEQAIRMALNGLQQTPAGYELRHPRHLVTFGPDGFTFTPRDGGPAWAWQMTAVLAREMPLSAVETGPLPPTSPQALQVAYPREGLVEQYLGQEAGIEQQFLLPQPLPLGGADLVIAGTVRSTGTLEQAADGWRWRTGQGEVHLGDVRAHDARGRELPAWMAVTADSTRIQVDGAALADAAYPVTIDPEIGANDFRLSDMGQDNTYDASSPAVAYNSTDNEYLVVWYRDDDDAGTVVDGEYEIYGQRVDAATGVEIGPELRLSDMGPDGDPAYDAYNPAVAYNSADNEYLVVWHGDDNTALLVEGEDEIFGQRVEANIGAEIGSDLRLSDMGPHSDPNYDARVPAVAYNSTANEYLVVWTGDDNTLPLVDEEFEIFGQRLTGAGAETGTNDFRLSDMGPDGNPAYDAEIADVIYNSRDNEYLVTWYGDDHTGTLVEGEEEIFGQRVDARGGQVGLNDFRLSDMGPDGDPEFGAIAPAAAFSSSAGQYLVVWEGDDNTPPLADNEFEIHGQRLNAATGAALGGDQRISNAGPDGDPAYGMRDCCAAVVYNSTNDEYLVVWASDDNAGGLVNDEFEIFGQLVDAATGAEIGVNDFRISDMGPDGNADYDAVHAAVAYNSTDNEYLVVWAGVDDLAGMVPGEIEIYGQRLDAATGAEVGVNDFPISSMGPVGSAAYGALRPAVAYNSTDNQYLVVWEGQDDTPPLVYGETEIFGQLLYADGGQLGPDDFCLSDMGPESDPAYDAQMPDVVYNSAEGEYLVVWDGDDDTGSLEDNELEVYGQRIEAVTGAQIGLDLRLSDLGPDGDPDYAAWIPAVAYNSDDNEYLVVWWGDDNTPPLVDEEFEIYGQRLDGATAAEIGINDFRLSDMGPDGSPDYAGGYPAVAYNSADHEYLVVWYGDNNVGTLANGEFEVYGQRVDAGTGAEIGGK